MSCECSSVLECVIFLNIYLQFWMCVICLYVETILCKCLLFCFRYFLVQCIEAVKNKYKLNALGVSKNYLTNSNTSTWRSAHGSTHASSWAPRLNMSMCSLYHCKLNCSVPSLSIYLKISIIYGHLSLWDGWTTQLNMTKCKSCEISINSFGTTFRG